MNRKCVDLFFATTAEHNKPRNNIAALLKAAEKEPNGENIKLKRRIWELANRRRR